MAAVDIAPSFGAELKDGFKPINAWLANGIAWLDDIQQFYRERSAIEREYSQKLNGLAKKYFEKKAKKSSSLSVGDNPTVTPGSLESASMTTWTVQLTTLESRAAEHERYSTQLVSNVAEPLKTLAAKYEDLRKQHQEYANKLEKERDGTYNDLKKVKGKYDNVCQEVENKRKKIENSFDHGKNKAQSAYQQQQSDMRNAKNVYLIAINVTNKQKERYYNEYVPELLDSMQGLNEARVSTVNKLWSLAASIEADMLKRSTQIVEHLSLEISRNNPLLDSIMFVRHNASHWQDPQDFAFEPSPVWLDDDVMASDPASKTFLMNILTKSKAAIGEQKRQVENKRREVEGAKQVRQLIRDGKDKRDEVEVVRAQFVHQGVLHEAERQMITAEVEVSTILAAVGDVSIGARKHPFKNETFRLPTNCDLCGDRIWGLNAKGLLCTDCGFACHSKCELKVPADCPGELNKDEKKKLKTQRQEAAAAATAVSHPSKNGDGESVRGGNERPTSLERSDTMGSFNTLSSGYAASAHRSVSGMSVKQAPDEASSPTTAPAPKISSAIKPRLMAPPPASYVKSNGDLPPEQRGRMLYSYQATGDGEITISEGQGFTVVEPDDGSGWIKIKPSSFGATPGLVPASYTELSAERSPAADGDRPISTATAASASTTSLTGSSDTPSSTTTKKKGPAVAPRRGAKKVKHVEALYTYSPSGDGEVAMEEGERMVLISPDQGDGWCEVESRAGKGLVPASWLKDV